MGVVAAGTRQFFALSPRMLNTVGGMGPAFKMIGNDMRAVPLLIVTGNAKKPCGFDKNGWIVRTMGVVTYGTFADDKGRMVIFFVMPVFLLFLVAGKTECRIRCLNGIFGARRRVVTTQTTPDRGRAMNKGIGGHFSVTGIASGFRLVFSVF